MTDTKPESLAAALALLQTRLPPITKDAAANVPGRPTYRYADLADITKALMPILGELGLSFSAKPTLYGFGGIGGDKAQFVLAYTLRHVSGQEDTGIYPLPNGKPQEVGSAITYARRYCLCAVTGVAPDDDDDDAAAAQAAPRPRKQQRGTPPERAAGNLPRNADGSISRSQVTDDELRAAGVMDSQQQKEHSQLRNVKAPKAAERRTEADPDDPWLDQPAPPLRVPQAARSKAGIIVQHFERLGITDKDERLVMTEQLAGRTEPIASTNDLTASEATAVLKVIQGCRDIAALRAAMPAPVDT